MQRISHSIFVVIPMPTLPVARLIGKALVALANSLDTHLYHGLVGNKIV